MYEYILGTYQCFNKDYLVLENHGIGYKIFTSGSTLTALPEKGAVVTMYIQQIVREDFIGLYGFLTKEELILFNLLLTISGVGPKAALSLLSVADADTLKSSIIKGREEILTKAPGIGKKTAQRVILELKDKIIKLGANNISSVEFEEDFTTETIEALIALGYSDREAKEAFKKIASPTTIEENIKACLKYLLNKEARAWKKD